ncbi:class I SAM-dependent methyltransferase [Shivajiella indica]|uniref:Class I SAM-dependent methyltransferase n=1 Tax=Shivajiella indica TaxID=872115 RepID=A0ABW5BEG0_9BACT
MNSQFWDEKFSLNPNLYGEGPNEFLKEQLSIFAKGKILFPGEGEGRNALYAASLGWDVTALDQSYIAQKHTLLKAEDSGLKLHYLVCDVSHFIPEPESFDLIALIYFHLPLSIRDNVHQTFEKSIRKGGTILIEGFGKKQLKYSSGGPKNEEMLYDIHEIKSSFPNIQWEYEFDGIIHLNEGKGHSGDGHVVRLRGKIK